jgi:hypothetical protein
MPFLEDFAALRPDMNPYVKAITPLADYRPLVEFGNGERRVFDLTFRLARVVAGSIDWPGEIDLCYDTIYMQSQPAVDAVAA